jgi:hypothetical protein
MPALPFPVHKIILVLLMEESFISNVMLEKTISGVSGFCKSAMAILFLCIMIRFLIDIIENGYSFNLLKRMIIQMIILGAIISPIVYPSFAKLYSNLYEIMMNHIGMSEIDSLRDAMKEFYNKIFDEGEAGVIKFGFIKIETTPINLLVPILVFMLFLISMYEIIMLPTILMCITIALTPFLFAFSPLFKDKIDKFVQLFTGLAFIYPLVLFGIATMLPVSITLLGNLLTKDNANLLMIFSLAYSLIIAYSLPLIGYMSGLTFISEARIIFPVTWAEYLIIKPIMFGFFQARKIVRGK